MPDSLSLPLIGFAAPSGTGKTTLLKQVLPLLRSRGLRVAVIKHTHHDFDIDYPGKDSYELRRAGASQMLIASDRRQALVTEYPVTQEPTLATLLGSLDPGAADLVLVEGFKWVDFPKIELHRPSLGKPPLFPRDNAVIAIATDVELSVATSLPILDINIPTQVADFICRFTGLCSAGAS